MATYTKYEPFIEGLMDKLFDLFGTTDTLKVAIASDAPIVATDAQLADATQVTGTGYTAGGEDTQNNSTRTGGTVTMTAVDVVWTGGAGGFTAGRYVILHDSTAVTNRLIAYWDYGANFTVGAGETMTVDFGASVMSIS